MSRRNPTLLLAVLGVCASTVLASAQAASSPTDPSEIKSSQINSSAQGSSSQASSSPVAFIYVTSSPSSGKNQINGYAAAANGSLSTIPGTPLSSGNLYLALNGAWLFGTDGMNIYSYSIASNGSLKQVDKLSVEPSGGLVNLFLDHTGGSLYTDYFTENNEYMAYSIDQSNGKLTYIDNVMGGPGIGSVTSFIGNNEYAYSSSCYHFTQDIYGLQRSRDGATTYLDPNAPFPATKEPGFYCPFLAAADPTNHVAVAMQPLNSNWQTAGPYQLAVYTADSAGNLTTTSTYSNMPTTEAAGSWGITDYWMSPSGKFLAVAGNAGLQIFHFNGANPITKYTNLIVSKEVDQVFWDNSNHLYAIGRNAGKLWVFTVTSTSVTQAPGSPHSITLPGSMIVLPK
jgi:hypothetical protein